MPIVFPSLYPILPQILPPPCSIPKLILKFLPPPPSLPHPLSWLYTLKLNTPISPPPHPPPPFPCPTSSPGPSQNAPYFPLLYHSPTPILPPPLPLNLSSYPNSSPSPGPLPTEQLKPFLPSLHPSFSPPLFCNIPFSPENIWYPAWNHVITFIWTVCAPGEMYIYGNIHVYLVEYLVKKKSVYRMIYLKCRRRYLNLSFRESYIFCPFI